MSPLEKKRMAVELLNVQASKAAVEFRIEERLDEIERLKETIKISEAKEKELKEKLEQAKENK